MNTQHFPNLQDWSLVIRRFDVIWRTLVAELVLPFCRDAVGVFDSPIRLGCYGSNISFLQIIFIRNHLTVSNNFNRYHHQHVEPLAWISLTLSCHFSLSFIASGRSSVLHPVSSHSCCMYVLAGCPAFTQPYVGVHGSTSLMDSSLLLQQCPACLVRLTWIVFVMGSKWPYYL